MLIILCWFKISIALDNADTLGWCLAKLKSVKGGFGVVDFGIGGIVKTDIIPLERIRPVNRKYVVLCFIGIYRFV